MMTSLAGDPRPAAASEPAAYAADLVACGSLEIGPDGAAQVRTIAALLPVGTKVYVNHLPRRVLADALDTLVALREAGLEPVPHVAARRVLSRAEARAFLERATAEAGVTKVLVVGGDDPQPRGPYADGAALLRDEIVAECGVLEVGLPGYPEGHPRIAPEALRQALQEKLALAAAQGLGTYMVTQFCFAPARVVEYCASLAHELPALPIYVGLAGPTEPRTLLRFARRCGVSASLRALRDQGMAAVRLVTHTDPSEQLAAVARYCLAHVSCNVVGVHLFSFGGAARTASWMQGIIEARATR
jgi:methylenetetrahydrofolate reductase (NADPH)